MPKRILIVDDDLATRTMLRDMLETGGHEVVGEASSGEEVVDRYRESLPDLVITDIVLPRLRLSACSGRLTGAPGLLLSAH